MLSVLIGRTGRVLIGCGEASRASWLWRRRRLMVDRWLQGRGRGSDDRLRPDRRARAADARPRAGGRDLVGLRHAGWE